MLRHQYKSVDINFEFDRCDSSAVLLHDVSMYGRLSKPEMQPRDGLMLICLVAKTTAAATVVYKKLYSYCTFLLIYDAMCL